MKPDDPLTAIRRNGKQPKYDRYFDGRKVGMKLRTLISGPKFRFWLAPDISVEERAEAAHALFRHLVDPPRSVAELRRVAIRAVLAQYQGSLSGRAKQLADRYRSYLASGWLRERDLETLPEPRETMRVLLHRLARLNGGASLSWRRLIDIASSPQG